MCAGARILVMLLQEESWMLSNNGPQSSQHLSLTFPLVWGQIFGDNQSTSQCFQVCLHVDIFWFLFVCLRFIPQILLKWSIFLLKSWTSTSVFSSSTGSSVTTDWSSPFIGFLGQLRASLGLNYLIIIWLLVYHLQELAEEWFLATLPLSHCQVMHAI